MNTSSFVRTSVVAVLGMVVCYGMANSNAASNGDQSESADAHIVGVVPITQVYADGSKVAAIAIQYDQNIRDAALKPADFTVQTAVGAQKITQVYTNTDDLPTSRRGLNGRYVILELSTDYVIPVPAHKLPTPPRAGGPPPAPRPEPVKEQIPLNSEVVTRVGDFSWDPAAHPATLKSSKYGGDGESVSINQVGKISTTDGVTFSATTAAKDNVYCRNLIVDGFLKTGFTSGAGNLKYNVHFPSHYDPTKKYPLVVFLDDSDAPSSYKHAEYLIHGLGGVVWAGKEDDAKHPAIVVVPALSRPLINESYAPTVETRGGQSSTPYLSVRDLVDDLTAKLPSVDKDRIYLTGQGDGARAAIQMMADRPNLFAAALLFAPDYNTSTAKQLSKANMWIVVSEGDASSYASMQDFTASLKADGARVGTAEWNGRADPAQFAADVRGLAAQGKNIEYTVLKKGTVVPSGLSDDTADNHAYTWRIGYSISSLRDWLFTQRKQSPNASL